MQLETAIERGKKKAKHTTGNKKLGQIIKARRIAIKQKNRILHALINKQNLAISFKLPPTTNKYCQSILIYPHNTSETPTENQTQIAINWTHKMEEVIRTLTGKANKKEQKGKKILTMTNHQTPIQKQKEKRA